MQVVGVPEWIVVIVQAMYNGAKVNGSCSDKFEVIQVVLGNFFMLMILC